MNLNPLPFALEPLPNDAAAAAGYWGRRCQLWLMLALQNPQSAHYEDMAIKTAIYAATSARVATS